MFKICRTGFAGLQPPNQGVGNPIIVDAYATILPEYIIFRLLVISGECYILPP